MKMLYILNIANRVNNFSYTGMVAALQCGFEFHIAGNWGYKTAEEKHEDELKYGIRIHQIDFNRTPYNPQNIRAYKQLLKLCKEEKYDVIHCNTPIGGVLGRLVGKKCKTPKVIYQAHGFHFYKGSSALSWLVYYPIEKMLAHITDVLITINREDYERAKKKMHLRNGGTVFYVPGVGIDCTDKTVDDSVRAEKRKELGIKESDVGVISMGDLIARKNYEVSINAIKKTTNHSIKLFICGQGPEYDKLNNLIIKLGLSDRVFMLGYRNDISDLLAAMDVFLITSKQEGLPRSTMEAMAAGLPCIASDIRGNTDLLKDIDENCLCKANDPECFAKALDRLSIDANLRKVYAEKVVKKIKAFDTANVISALSDIYSRPEEE